MSSSIFQSPEHPQVRMDAAHADRAEADARYARLRNAFWVLAFLVLLACAPVIVLASWRWGL